MAKGNMMLQISVEQILDPAVTGAPEIWAVALDSLDGDVTTVREISTEKNQLFYGFNTDKVEFGVLSFSATAISDLWLGFPDLRRPPTILHAPSHVASPPINGARLVILRVRDFGFGLTHPGIVLVIGRRIGSHAYLEEVKL